MQSIGGFNTNTSSKLITIALLLALCPGLVMADNAIMQELGSKAAKTAMQDLKVEKGDANVLVLTSAGHAIIDGQTTQAALKGLSAETGNSLVLCNKSFKF